MSSRNTKAHSCIRNSPNRGGSRFSTNHAGGLGFGTPVLGRFYLCDGFENAIILRERAPPRGTPFVAMLLHPSGFEPEQGVEQIVRVSPKKRSSQAHNPVCTRGQGAQSIALSGVAGQLVNLVANGVIEPSRHIAPDEFNRCHAANLVGIGLPQRTVNWPTGLPFPGLDGFGDLDLLKLCDGQPAVINKYRHARVGINHTSQIWPGARHAVSMPPEIAKLRTLPT